MERSGHVYSRISQPDQRGARGAHRRARRRRRRHRHRERPGRAAPRHRHAGRRRLAHRRLARALRRLAQPAALHAARASASRPPSSSPRDIDAWRAAIRPEHAAAVRRDARQPRARRARHPARSRRSRTTHGLPLLVDSTFTTPWLMRPFEHGADLRLSTRRPSSCRGHGTVDRRRAGRRRPLRLGRAPRVRRFPELTEPYDGFHGMVFTEESTVGAFLLRARREGPARLRRLHEPAHRLADPAGHRDAAAAHGAPRREHAQGRRTSSPRTTMVERVGYPELDVASRPRARASACCRAAAARCSASTCDGSREQGARLHRGAAAVLAPRQRRRLPLAGDPPGLDHALPHGRRGAARRPASAPGTIRLSIGLEDADDLIDDLKRALEGGATAAA